MNAKLTAKTEADLLRGMEWFDTISFGLGDQFESEFFNALEPMLKFSVNLADQSSSHRHKVEGEPFVNSKVTLFAME